MRVLGNSVPAKDLATGANCLHDFPVGMSLMDHVSWLLTTRTAPLSMEKKSSPDALEKRPMNAVCYHQEINDGTNVTGSASYFAGHRDKGFVHQAIFVPLSERIFYTFIGIPIEWKVHQDRESHSLYSKWKETLPSDEKDRIINFETSFDKEARWHMTVDVETRIFRNQLGSVLSFPANTCYHATLTPGQCTVNGNITGRDLFIIHPLDLTT